MFQTFLKGKNKIDNDQLDDMESSSEDKEFEDAMHEVDKYCKGPSQSRRVEF
jgi:hypothetical protein